MGFSSLHMYNLLLVLLGIADVKRSMTFGNINKPLKVLVQLDSLTCCPEVELSLTEEAFSGLNGDGENHCLSAHLCLACFLGCFPGSRGRTGPPFWNSEGLSCPRELDREPVRFYITIVPIFD